MKKIFNILKKRSELIIGLFIGLVVATSICYGVNQIQSSSVSYTRDGKTMSVEEAIDDLIVKVNKKNEQISVPIGLGETLQLKSTEENETWESSNEDVATVDSNGIVTGKSKGTAKITVKNDNVSSSVNVTIYPYLADVVSVGDYVAYDAGSWTETKAKPTNQGQFGGYTKGQNKANSVSWCYESQYTTTLKGWRVFKIDTSTKIVTLVHAGEPECYHHAEGGYGYQSATNLNNRATSEYLNSDYASGAHGMSYYEALSITGSESATTNDLRYIGPNGTTGNGAYYYLANAGSDSLLWGVNYKGSLGEGSGGTTQGFRPIVVLKPNILTTGKGTDKVGQEAWTLVKP